MANKDQILLESLYSQILENTHDEEKQDPREGLTDHEIAALEAEEETKDETSDEKESDEEETEKSDEDVVEDSLEVIYDKIVQEAKKKWDEGSKYAICTKTVGRENEAKYKRCKEKVEKSHKKAVAKKKKK